MERNNLSSEAEQNIWRAEMQNRLRQKEEKDDQYLEELRNQAVKDMREPFDTERLAELYYPNDLGDDPRSVERNLEGLEVAYLTSDAKTLGEWALHKTRVDSEGDS